MYKWIFFSFGQILFNLTCTFAAHHDQSFVLCFLRYPMITYLITLSLEKKILIFVFKKNFGSKNLYKPCPGKENCCYVAWIGNEGS